jgi:omega-6 fatty acid desaturase (delta-12 desaturase)
MEVVDATIAIDAVRVASHADQRSLVRGLAIFMTYAVLYGATLIDALGPFPLVLNLAAGIGNGICIAMLFIIGHDCCHGAFVPGRRWNLWLGRFAFIPVVHSVSLWRVAHNGNHHGRTNLKGVDPVWAPMSPREYANASPARRFVERVYRSAFGPAPYYFFEIWIALMIAPMWRQARAQWLRHLPDTVFVLMGFAATLAAVGWLGGMLAPQRPLWLVLTLGWGVPFAAWHYLAGITVYLNHTHPDVAWFDDECAWSAYNGNVLGTVHVKMPIDIFPLYSDVMAHPAHHTNVSTPVYALPQAQEALKARAGGEITEYTLSLAEYRRILKDCKLFDFEARRWTDFAGVPTGPQIHVRPPDFAPARAPGAP